jgi:hypothetical protein
MNKKQLLTMSTLTALFLVACGEASSLPSSQPSTSSVSSLPSSQPSTSSVSSSVTTSSQPTEVNTWGVVNGNFQTEVAFGTATQAGLWNVFIPTPEADGITATASYKTETGSTNKFGAMNIASIDTNGKTTQWWHAQFRQNGIYLNGGGSYVLSFRVRALEARTIRVQIQGGGLTSKPTSLNELPVQIGTTWETKTINFTAPSDADNAELQFGLGPDSFLPNDLVGFARKFGEVHLDDVKIDLGEPLPNTAPRISGGDLLFKTGTSDLLLIKSGLAIRDDYDRNLSLTNVTALDITQGPKLNSANPTPGIYTFLYTATDSLGLVGTHQRQIIVTDPNQLLNNKDLSQFGPNGMPLGWAKWNEDNNGGQRVTAGVTPHLLPESLLGNIRNGNFSQPEAFTGGAGWSNFISSVDGVNATMTRVNEELVFATTSVTDASQFWHAQLIHGGNIRLPKGNFRLSFRAKAAAARTIRVALEGDQIRTVDGNDVRAINEQPVLLSTSMETYTIDFTTTKHVYGSTLRFFFGPDSGLPTDLIQHARKTATVTLDDITFKYENSASPVATFTNAMSVDIWRIVSGGFPWENQIKYEKLPFYQGTYRLSFKGYAEAARPVMLAMEGSGGLTPADPNRFNVFEFTTTPQAFTYDIIFANDSTNASKFLGFFMGSYARFGTGYNQGGDTWFNDWITNSGITVNSINASDDIATMVYFFDFSLDKVA